jgi:hypothetical protein
MFKNIELFHTPKNLREIQNWLDDLPAEQRVTAMTAAYMVNNLAAVKFKQMEKESTCKYVKRGENV